MKKLLAITTVLICLISCTKTPTGDYHIHPVSFTEVSVKDAFWSPRMETNQNITIPYTFQQCENTHRIDNFVIAGGLKKGYHRGYRFNDSDVYKIIEGAAYSLQLNPNPKLEAYVDKIIGYIAAAQEEDGYLFTAKTAMNPDNPSIRVKDRWDNIRDDHELYCVGHMYEAAVAYFQATGKRKLLDVAIKNAHLIDSVFGPQGLRFPPGHQEIEIGLTRLYRQTGEKRYLNLAKFFLDQRGDSTGHKLYGEYAQDHMPVINQKKAVGHAVRAGYLFTGMADIAALTDNEDYITAISRIWEDVVSNKLYITGGIGASGGNEGFGGDYHLPNEDAYCETCAAIANAMWNHRLFLMTGDAKYMDIVERAVYNNILSGISMEGNRFFYPNRLASFNGTERAPWFGCACCPSNIVRFLPSIPGYAYGKTEKDFYINLYISSSVKTRIGLHRVQLQQQSNYPWDGHILIKVNPEKIEKFTIHLRIPGWAEEKPVPGDLYRYNDPVKETILLTVNDTDYPLKIKDGYARISRIWQIGDEIKLYLPMTSHKVIAHDSVKADLGRIALERGPIVFCAEGIDNPDKMVRHLILPKNAALSFRYQSKKLRGIQIIAAKGMSYHIDKNGHTEQRPVTINFIPYYAWAHRGKTPMAVWIADNAQTATPLRSPTPASQSKVTVSYRNNPEAANN